MKGRSQTVEEIKQKSLNEPKTITDLLKTAI